MDKILAVAVALGTLLIAKPSRAQQYPTPCALATIYSAAITATATHPSVGHALIDLLTSPVQRAVREQAGFLTL